MKEWKKDINKKKHRECYNKVRYNTQELAEEALEVLKIRNESITKVRNKDLHIYKCSKCSQWHLGHKIKKKKKLGTKYFKRIEKERKR